MPGYLEGQVERRLQCPKRALELAELVRGAQQVYSHTVP